MKSNCPYCSTKLKWKLVRSKALPGRRKILPDQAAPICPSCGEALAVNTHWSEFVAELAVLIPFAAALVLGSSLERTTLRVFLLAALILCASVFAYFHFRYWRHMQRYLKRRENAA